MAPDRAIGTALPGARVRRDGRQGTVKHGGHNAVENAARAEPEHFQRDSGRDKHIGDFPMTNRTQTQDKKTGDPAKRGLTRAGLLIGGRLKACYDHVVAEPLPAQFRELLHRLDEATQGRDRNGTPDTG